MNARTRNVLKMLVIFFSTACLCGVTRSARPSPRKDPRSYVVSLINKNTKLYCGGAIIRKNWILTAAKCSFVCGEGFVCAVRYGSWDLDTGRYAPIRIFAVHPDSNIAVAEAPLLMRGDIKLIPILVTPLPSEATMTAVGWRWTRSPRMCYRRVKKTRFRRVECVRNETICAVSVENNMCFGDYGGPLIYQDKLIGISSFGLIEIRSDDDGSSRNNLYATNYVLNSKHSKRSGIYVQNPDISSISANPGELQKASRPLPIRSSTCNYPGYGIFVQASWFVSWIDQTIRNYTEEYDLDNVPPPDEWSEEFIKANYDFEKSPIQC